MFLAVSFDDFLGRPAAEWALPAAEADMKKTEHRNKNSKDQSKYSTDDHYNYSNDAVSKNYLYLTRLLLAVQSVSIIIE